MRPWLGGERARLTALYGGLLMLSGVLLTTVVHLLVKLGLRRPRIRRPQRDTESTKDDRDGLYVAQCFEETSRPRQLMAHRSIAQDRRNTVRRRCDHQRGHAGQRIAIVHAGAEPTASQSWCHIPKDFVVWMSAPSQAMSVALGLADSCRVAFC